MLTPVEKAIVKSTVPLLEKNGVSLTQAFYKRMLNSHPEVRPYFDPRHQKDLSQPRALAYAVLMYAKHIDALEKLGNLPRVIVEKHVALGVKREHYPIVGSELLATMREILGPKIATEEVIAAWGRAYQELADLLIEAEAKAYDELEATKGGWRGVRRFKIVNIHQEYEDVRSLVLAPVDGRPVIKVEPGQYAAVVLDIDGQRYHRPFSLSNLPDGKIYRITVKRTGPVSDKLHTMHIGDEVGMLAPYGGFTLDKKNNPVVLIGGGIGVTPLAAMAASLAETDRDTTLMYYAHDSRQRAFSEDIKEWAQNKNFHVKRVGNRPTLDDLDSLPRDADVYFVGPKGFMAAVDEDLLKVGYRKDQLHYEFFGSLLPLA